jgi:hypothetical protein
MKYIIVILLLVSLTACSPSPERIVVRTPNQQLELIQPMLPRSPNIENIEVIVYDQELLVEELNNSRFEPIVGMSPRNYERLLNNLVEIHRYMQSQRTVIQYYENFIRDSRQ